MATVLLFLLTCILSQRITAESDIPKSDPEGQNARSDKDKEKIKLRLVNFRFNRQSLEEQRQIIKHVYAKSFSKRLTTSRYFGRGWLISQFILREKETSQHHMYTCKSFEEKSGVLLDTSDILF